MADEGQAQTARSARRVSFCHDAPGMPLVAESEETLERSRSHSHVAHIPFAAIPEAVSGSLKIGSLNQSAPRRPSAGKIVDELDALRDRTAEKVTLPGLDAGAVTPGGGVLAAAMAALDHSDAGSVRRRDLNSAAGRRPSLSPAFERTSMSRGGERERSAERPADRVLHRSGSASVPLDEGLQVLGQHLDSPLARSLTPGAPGTSSVRALRHASLGGAGASMQWLHIPDGASLRGGHSPLLHPAPEHLRAGSHPPSPASCPSPLPMSGSPGTAFSPLASAASAGASAGASAVAPARLPAGPVSRAAPAPSSAEAPPPPFDALLDGETQLVALLDAQAEALAAAREAAAGRARALREAAERERERERGLGRGRPEEEEAALARELAEAAGAMAEQEAEAAAASEVPSSLVAERARLARAALERALAFLGRPAGPGSGSGSAPPSH
eukprot:tig00001208_g7531.t1